MLKSKVLRLFFNVLLFYSFSGQCNAAESPKNLRHIYPEKIQDSADAYSVYIVKAISNNRILPTDTLSANLLGNVITVTLAPGEYEPVSFVVRAKENVRGLKPVPSNLISESYRISSSNIDVKLVKSWYQGCSNSIHYKHCPGGPNKVLMPELLLMDDKLVLVDRKKQVNYLRVTADGVERYVDISTSDRIDYKRDQEHSIPLNSQVHDSPTLLPVDINQSENQQFWATIYIPPGAQSGQYNGRITLKCENVTDMEIKIFVNVLPFNLDDSKLDYALYYRGRISATKPDHLSPDYKDDVQLESEIRNMIRHGVVLWTTTQSSYPPDLFKKYLSLLDMVGMKKSLYMLWASTYLNDMDSAKKLMDYAKQYGFNSVYFFGGDELTEAQWDAQLDLLTNMRNNGGKIFASIGNARFAPYFDHANTSKLDDGFIKTVRAHGTRLYLYGKPQVGVEEPETYRRNYGIKLWQRGFDGVMDYAFQDGWGSIWNDFDGYFRDHVFAYPTSGGVIDTIQWEGFREAADDVKYLSTLLNTIEEAKNKGLSTEAAEGWIGSLNTSGNLDKIRGQMIDYIMALKGLKMP